jgi:hypothetical protein
VIFLASLALVAGIAAGALLLGRALAGAMGQGLLRRFTPTGAAASAFIGTAVAVVAYGWLTACGLRATQILPILCALLAVLLIATWTRGQLDVLRPRGNLASWAALLGPMLLSAILCLLPLVRGDWNAGNDTFTYCAVSERLQETGFRTPVVEDEATPVIGVLRFYHGTGLRLASAYLLALVQAATAGPASLLVYPAAATWVFLLQMGAVALCLRWALRLSDLPLAGALFAFAVLPHPGQFAHHDGFFAQPCGIAALLVGTALCARVTRGARGKVADGMLLALVAAFLVAVYMPLAPVLAAAAAWQAAQALWRGHRRGHAGRPALFIAGTTAAFLVFAFLDLRALRGTLATLASIPVGGHIAQNAWDWVAFAAGTSPGGGSSRGPWRFLAPLAAIAACGLALLGAAHLGRRSRTRIWPITYLVLAGSLGYYALFVADPWTGRTGHTWNAFKLVQWSYPLVFLLQCGGLRALPGRWRRAATTLALLLALALAPEQAVWLRADRATSLAGITRTRRPLARVTALRQGLRGLPPGRIVLLGRAPGRRPWFLHYLALLAYPRPVVREQDAEIPERLDSASPARDPVLLVCRSPTTPVDPAPDLGWGCGPPSLEEPSVVELDGRGPARRDAGPLRVVLFAPHETEGDLVIDLPRRPDPWPAVSVQGENGPLAQIPPGPALRWRVHLKLRSGLNRLQLRAAGRDATPPSPLAARFSPRAAAPP